VHDHKVALRYAEAIFNVARDQKVVADVEADLAGIADLLHTTPAFAIFIKSPDIPRDEKLRIVDELFASRVKNPLSLKAVRLLLQKRREAELEGVYDAFVTLRREHERTIFVTISSSSELDKKSQSALIEKAHALTGQKIEAEFLVEPQLLGGVKIAYENVVLDGTVRGNLNKLRNRLSQDLLTPV
jgi:F-type H+-transporting ATPase subunit delta